MGKSKIIVEYYRYRYPNNQNEDCYDIYIENENKERTYLCGGFDQEQVNIARFALEKYINRESLLTNKFKVNDEVKVCGKSGAWYDGIITNITDEICEVLIDDGKEKLSVYIQDLDKIKLKEE